MKTHLAVFIVIVTSVRSWRDTPGHTAEDFSLIDAWHSDALPHLDDVYPMNEDWEDIQDIGATSFLQTGGINHKVGRWDGCYHITTHKFFQRRPTTPRATSSQVH